MPKTKYGLKFDGWKETIAKLDEIGGSEAMRRGTDEALRASKEYVNGLIESAIKKLPAHGKYSTGRTENSIDKDNTVEWEGLKAAIKIGFNFKDSGLVSIYLMYGTPRMKPVSGLKNAIYGAKTQKEVAKIQSDAINAVINEIMEGKQ